MAAAALLVGEPPGEAVFAAAAETAARQEMDPAGDIHASAAFKRHLAEVLGRRVLREAWARCGDPRRGGSPPRPGRRVSAGAPEWR